MSKVVEAATALANALGYDLVPREFEPAKVAAAKVDLYEQIPVQVSGGFIERSAMHKALDDRREQQERAKRTGFTGNACSTCGGTRMMRNGSCESCADCGTTTGCG